jgi:competence protein ComEC
VLQKEIPFLRIGLSLCTGIITGLYFKPDNLFLFQVAVIITAGFITSLFFNKYQTNLIFGFTFNLALFTSGLLLYTIEKNNFTELKPEQTQFSCTLTDYPEEKENTFRLTVKLNNKITISGSEAVYGSMILYNKKDSSLASLLPGDRLVIKCTPVLIVNRGNPFEFDYRFFMENQGVRYYAFTNSRNILNRIPPEHRNLIHRALIIREKIIWMYKERGITGQRLALVAAMTLGQKNMLDPEQKQNFIKAGVMHIMAVSGLHSVILSLFVFNVLFFMKRRFNILRILITILILWAFAFVTGLTPSVLRATLMFTFIQAGSLMKRQVNGINSVLASAFVLILIKPSVIFDAGFLLSYSAVIYIISFYQDMYLRLHIKNWLADKIWQSAVVTIVAQAGTLPLTIMLFNRFPTYFILTNIIIVPLSSLLIIIGCIVPLTYPVYFLSKFFAVILDNLTGLTELLTARAASLPWSTLENIGMTTVECVLLTVTIFLFSYFLLKRKPFSIIYPLSILVLFAFSVTVIEIHTRTTNEIIVYNTPGRATIGIRTGKILNVYSDTALVAPEVLRHSATLGLKLKSIIPEDKTYCIAAGEKKILICRSPEKKEILKFMPDIVIITGIKPETKNFYDFSNHPGTIIISSKASSGFDIPGRLKSAVTYTVHSVRKSGAFIKRI